MNELYSTIAQLRLDGYTVLEARELIGDISDKRRQQAQREARKFFNVSREVSSFVTSVLMP